MRPIDADAVYKIIESYEIRKETIGNPLSDWEYGYTCGIERAESEIECAPTVDAEPVRHGRWESVTEDWRNQIMWWNCSECDCEVSTKYNYCPNCGAKMDGEREEE